MENTPAPCPGNSLRKAVIAELLEREKKDEAVANALRKEQRAMDEEKRAKEDAQQAMEEAISAMHAGSPKEVVEQMFHAADEQAKIVRLRTGACFFPKFSYDDDVDENTAAASTAQTTMREALESGDYQVRVSPKHSGSLALWNIEKDFFQAKNSAANLFTVTSQIVLTRVIASSCPGETLQDKLAAAKEKIELIKREYSGLCIGMEVVTRGLTGEHGDIPLVNYAVVTSICRTNVNGPGRFFGASEVVEFCCRYGLLWNEAFVITSPESLDEFFRVHTNNLIHGTDSIVIPLLRQLANVHIPAVPHAELQGDRLEGVVVRLEPRESNTCAELAASSVQQFSLDTLRAFSQDLDDIWSQCEHNEDAFLSHMQPEIDQVWGSGRITRIPKAEADAIFASILSMEPSTDSTDPETAGIQGLLKLLQRKEYRHIGYKGIRLADGSICFIVHVKLDRIFATFNRTAPSGTFPLYRGFSFIVETSETVGSIRISHVYEPPAAPEGTQLSCMFKAKFMPYMIRTFIMRNCGLKLCESILGGESSAQSAYKMAVLKYLKSWVPPGQMLQEAIAKYYSYLIGWGTFLQSLIQKGIITTQTLEKNGRSYLGFLAMYEQEIQEGKFSVPSGDVDLEPGVGSVIFVTYPGKAPEGDSAFHKQLESKFGSRAVIIDASEMKNCEMLQSPANIKALVKSGSIVIVLVDLTNSSMIRGIEATIASVQQMSWWVYSGIPDDAAPFDGMAPGLLKKASSLSRKWLGLLSTSILPEHKIVPEPLTGMSISAEIPLPNLFPHLMPELAHLLEPLQASRESMSCQDTQVCVVIFPGIPGCGKSTLASVVSALEASTGYKVFVWDGDEPTKKKFWSQLWQFIHGLPLYGGKYLIIAAKNAPPSTHDGSGNFYRQLRDDCPKGVHFIAVVPEDEGTETHPFGLNLVSLCMKRVMARKSTDHNSLFGTDAWKIVSLFYSFYKDIDREQLLQKIKVLTPHIVDLPVVSREAVLPEDLRQLVEECIHSDKVPTDLVLEMFEHHKQFLDGLSPSLKTTSAVFVEQVSAILNSLKPSSSTEEKHEYIGAFVNKDDIQMVLTSLGIASNKDNFHATLWHPNSDEEPPVDLIGRKGTLVVDAVFEATDCTQVAFQVSSITIDGEDVLGTNDWLHITVACEKGKAAQSNNLPGKLLGGTATKREFPPMSLSFTVMGK